MSSVNTSSKPKSPATKAGGEIDRLKPVAGSPAKLEDISIYDLKIDDEYQRSLSSKSAQTLIRNISLGWNWQMCQTLEVALRPDGMLYVVDGQTRLNGALRRAELLQKAGRPIDVPTLPCLVTKVSSKSDEAATFTKINGSRRALNAVDIHRAKIVAGDKEACEVSELISSAGLKLAPHSNYTAWKPLMLYCIPGITSAYKRHGRAITSNALVALAEAYPKDVLRYAGQILRALFVVYATEGTKDDFDPDVFIDRLSMNTQAQWMRKGQEGSLDGSMNARDALVASLIDAYRKAL